MDPDQNKSVAVDYETWKVLVQWAEDECRSVGGQIRYLVKKYAPEPSKSSLELKDIAIFKPKPAPEPEPPVGGTPSINDGEWESRPLGQAWFRQQQTQRGVIVETLLDYNQPVTNTELQLLCEASDKDQVKELNIDEIGKQTSGMWSRGLLKRRKSKNKNFYDRFEYQLTEQCVKLLTERNKKITQKRNQRKTEASQKNSGRL